MHDKPVPDVLVTAVAAFLRETQLPVATGRLAYDLRVAINALDLVARQIANEPGDTAAERARLVQLLDTAGDLDTLNRRLCARLRDGDMTLATPGVAAHLWQTTLAKLAVDQPGYAAYRAETGPAMPAPPRKTS